MLLKYSTKQVLGFLKIKTLDLKHDIDPSHTMIPKLAWVKTIQPPL